MPKACEQCGQFLNVERDAVKGLSIGCNCRRRPVKVASVLPEEWEA